MDPNTGLGPLSKKEGVPFDSEVLLASFKVRIIKLFILLYSIYLPLFPDQFKSSP